MTTLVVDGANVVGAGAGGWWRDPPAAMRKLADRIACYCAATSATAVLVLDRAQADLPDGYRSGVRVVTARRRGPNAADDRIVALIDEGDLDASALEVVTSDRALAAACRGRGAQVAGAGTFLRRLESAGC